MPSLTPPEILLVDLPARLAPLAAEIEAGFHELLASGRFIGGEVVARFEEDFARACGVSCAVGVGNGTDALVLALRALGIGPGDVVLVPGLTFIATATAVSAVGATPRFVDVDPVTYTLDAGALERADLTGVRAVIPVHLYGQPAELDPIMAFARERGLFVIEDAAQAHGATYGGRPVGSFGDLAAFSFYPGKNLGALGDAGALVGSDRQRLERVRSLGNHGRRGHDEHVEIGMNSRLDSVQAMALRVSLRHLPAWNAARAQVAGWYDARLAHLPGIVTPAAAPGRTHVYHLYVVQVPRRDVLRERLQAAGIQCGVHYPRPVYAQPAYASLGLPSQALPVSHAVASRCLSLPCHSALGFAEVERVAEIVADHIEKSREESR